ncbi:hypothetical protein FRC12_006478, partial [Ceratobasidium sp. 428]
TVINQTYRINTNGVGLPEGYGLVYGDNKFSSINGATFEDRLRSLMRQQGDELRAFTEREGRNIGEIPSQAVTMANTSPHEFLYSAMQSLTPQETITKMDAALEHLHQILGYDGFFAIVTSTPMATVKQELDSAMRNVLREAAGDPLAEMRWTKLEQLEGYGVRIIGWPPDIGLRNPSNNPARYGQQNLPLLAQIRSTPLRQKKTLLNGNKPTPAHSSIPLPKRKPNLKSKNTPPPNSSNHPNL